ncbi:lysophospholipid acyltransferase family protein [Aquabacter spiritensis]|uniref:Lyso-ornithine lipid acyltransferase n=1 Tax=Aquabacter spiritensis TaxID=933073 RepID=A0A4R3LZX4_9HYPH|nr:lysophospholipid acyltransferase family protein [Aquabacter spiritensis]TCT06252.1 lyso-ornithine lipid acyltransferase [Aquabacter spiritensis]
MSKDPFGAGITGRPERLPSDPDLAAIFHSSPMPDLGPEPAAGARLLDRVRMGLVFTGVGLVTAVGIPLQWLAVKLALAPRRHIPKLYHRIVLKLIGVRVHVSGTPAPGRPLLLLSNHVSWLDISVVGSLFPLFFVAKSEVRRWPVIGLLAVLQRTVFVDRERRHATGTTAREIGQRLSLGDPVVLFAEGTSGDGNRVLPFRTALVGAAREAFTANGTTVVQPMSIAYVRLQGIPMGRSHRGIAAWVGDLDLAPHLFEAVRQGAIDVQVTFGEPRLLEADADRKSVTRDCEAEVRRLTETALMGAPVAPRPPPP